MTTLADARQSPLPSSAGAMTPRHVTRLREQARTLAGAKADDREADPLRVAGHVMDRRGVPLLRLILASAALAIIYVDPAEPDRHVPLTYATLTAYTVYAAVVLAASMHNRPLPRRLAHWVDVAWHTLLISLSSGTNSLFFFFYFFNILVASFRCGATEGLRVTGVSALLITSVGYQFSPAETFELNRFLLRPVCLLVLGYMISYWGGLEHRLKQRLTLLREMTLLRNPRFGIDDTLASALEKLRRLFDADVCLLAIADGADCNYWLYQSRRDGKAPIRNPEPCSPEMAGLLLALPHTEAVLADSHRSIPWWGPAVHVEDVVTRRVTRKTPEAMQVLLGALDCRAVATVPVRCHHEAVGRLYVGGRSRTFDVSDLEFLMHAMDTTIRVTENLRLVDRLAAEAADNERRRIARGIHHTVIQPYIGLQLGLGAILDRMVQGDRDVEPALERMLSLVDGEVARMREYVVTLRGMPDPQTTLMDAVRRFGRQFQSATGIEVYVDGPPELRVSERVAAELFEMATEGLSNVRRHTSAHRIAIGVQRTADAIALTIENDGPAEGAAPFEPRSLREHAIALGGTLDIHRRPGTTVVAITVPL
jgi:signal transduction histidine kinase